MSLFCHAVDTNVTARNSGPGQPTLCTACVKVTARTAQRNASTLHNQKLYLLFECAQPPNELRYCVFGHGHCACLAVVCQDNGRQALCVMQTCLHVLL